MYPTQSNSTPSNVLSNTGTNNANFYNGSYTDPTNGLTSVGAFAASPGAYGTFDQGGNVLQYNESIIDGSYRGLRGGSFSNFSSVLQSGSRSYDRYPSSVNSGIGFRVSQVPEPASLGFLGMGVIGLLARRKRACR